MSVSKTIWQECKRLIIVLPYSSDVNYKNYRSALDVALNKSNVVELKIIVVLNDSVKKETLQEHKLIRYLSAKDISFFGKIKDENLIKTLAQPYDALLWFEVENAKIAKLLSGIHAKWKIGVNTSLDQFNLRLNSQTENPVEIVNFAQNILEIIHTL